MGLVKLDQWADVSTVMWPAAQYALCWHAIYHLSDLIFSMTLVWYSKPQLESVAFYKKKLGLGKRSDLTDQEKAKLCHKYAQNYFVTSFLSSIHGIVMGYYLIPFVQENPDFLVSASISTISTDERVVKACLIFVAYVFNDFLFCFPMALKYGLSDDWLFVVHHVTLVFTWTSFCVESWGHLFAIPTMLTEMTAPLVFTTWAMKEFRLTTNPLFIVFGIALLAMWYVLRIYGYVIFLTLRLWALRAEVMAPETVVRNLAVLAFHLLGCAMQVHWGKALTMVAVRSLTAGGKKKSKEGRTKKAD